MPERTCTVPGCERLPRSRTADLCNAHYFRRYRYGDIGAAEVSDRRRKSCVMAGCERLASVRGYCDLHHQRIKKWGDPNRVDPKLAGERHGCWTGDAAGYGAAHDRVRRAHGAATAHPCRHCGEQAAHWAYDHMDPNDKHGPSTRPYSLDPAHYLALCVSCHKRFDLAYIATASRAMACSVTESN